ncbi:hypothetical protein [Alloalcanivorax profundimaris]|uniref:hypothetical protein n=1 Tax=Alloalcanivorax profundimaris TaxID=2735259 RepID=UPI001E4672B1|nr:hypothetical protein [Alloalcanivorax profundimaris]MBF1803593.1 hypothetical protein [Alloalcanivorax profundimaris]
MSNRRHFFDQTLRNEMLEKRGFPAMEKDCKMPGTQSFKRKFVAIKQIKSAAEKPRSGSLRKPG